MNKVTVNKIIIIIFIALSYLVFTTPFSTYTLDQVVKNTIVIDPNGVINVTVTLLLDKGLNKVMLPVDPIPMTIIALRDEEDIPIIYDEGYLYLYLDRVANVSINYIANVTIENNVFILNIKSPDIIELRISKEIVLLSWPDENIIDIGYTQGMLTLWIRGPAKISYVVRAFVTETTSRTTIPTSSTPGVQGQTTTTGLSLWLALVLGIVGVGIGVTFYYLIILRRKRVGGEHVLSMLSDIDKAILKALEARGGSAFQTELQNDVKVPRTTLWRHIKKLEKIGIVNVEKVGLQNRVKLVKKIKLE